MYFIRVTLVMSLVLNLNASVFDDDLYESALNAEQCKAQIKFLEKDELLLTFLDASGKLPSGILNGNINHLGNYYQCLAIQNTSHNLTIEGKYCLVSISIKAQLNQMISTNAPFSTLPKDIKKYLDMRRNVLTYLSGRNHSSGQSPSSRLASSNFQGEAHLAVCIPKVCNTSQTVDYVQDKLKILNVTYKEQFCRIPGDKPVVAVDILAIVIFTSIAALIVLSTLYDLNYELPPNNFSKRQHHLFRSFSIQTNTRRLLTFKPVPGSIECLDGVRAISMLWVIVGHTFANTAMAYLENGLEVVKWLRSVQSVWITSAPAVVDTFFLMSGILVVYTVLPKTGCIDLLRRIPCFIAHRYLRMFPLLASVILLQSSLFHHLSDGPNWQYVGSATNNCRTHWWNTILYIQNYVDSDKICLPHTWYLAVDMQLYVVAPIIMIFLYLRKPLALISLAAVIAASLLINSIICFKNNFPSSVIAAGGGSFSAYFKDYYINTLARAPPFVIGMFFGYFTNSNRDKAIKLCKIVVISLWFVSIFFIDMIILSTYITTRSDHNNTLLDNLINSYSRAVWALAVGWIVFACHHGYGGPINYFLSLNVWKLPSRLSYAMYLVHFPLQGIVNGSWTSTKYFTVTDTIYRSLSDIMVAFASAFVLAIAIDAPFSTLQKMALEKITPSLNSDKLSSENSTKRSNTEAKQKDEGTIVWRTKI